jgi:hypothetical protein
MAKKAAGANPSRTPAASGLYAPADSTGRRASQFRRAAGFTLGGPRSLDLTLTIEVTEVGFGPLARGHRRAQFLQCCSI